MNITLPIHSSGLKKFLVAFVSFLLCFAYASAQEVSTTSKITDVTVYRTLAKETRTAFVNIPAGNSDVVISGITLAMQDQSLQVAVKGEGTLLSAMVRTNYFSDTKPDPFASKKEKLNDSIHSLDISKRWIAEQKSIHNGEITLLNELLRSANIKEEYKPSDLNAMADIYRTRITELKTKLFHLQLEDENLNQKKEKIQGQIAEMVPETKTPVKEIVLSFTSETATSLQLKTSYVVTGASWAPMYDVCVLDVTQPVNLVYKASITQSTGMDWKDVKITVSTGNPSVNNNRPILNPVYVDYVQYAMFLDNGASLPQMNSMYAERITTDTTSVNLFPEVAVTDHEILVEFAINAKQNIPSDGKQHVCRIKEYSIPATYRYHTVPKLDNGAFLLARITDYGKYNLLDGNANIFMGDTYIGMVLLNPSVTADTLLLSLGRDDRIVVKRTRMTEKCTKKFLSGKQTDTYAYEITVRNNKTLPIEIEILDQIPLTRREEIEVKLIEGGNAKYNEVYGKLIWTYKIAPSSSKDIKLTYSVTYPEGKIVSEK